MSRNYVLIAYRLENKLKQREMAKLIGITQAYLCNLENGVKEPSFEVAKKIADIIGEELSIVFPKYRP